MAWYDNFPTSMGSQWLDQILGEGPSSGMAGAGNWFDSFPGAGSSGPPTFQNFGGADLLSDLYGGGGGGGGGYAAPVYSSPIQGLYQNYTPAPMSSYPSMQAIQFQMPQAGGYGATPATSYPPMASSPFQMFPSGSGGYGSSYGQSSYGGSFPSVGQQSGGASQRMRAPSGGGTQPYGGAAGPGGGQQLSQGYGQQYGQQAGATQASGYAGGTSNPANVSGGGGDFASPLPGGGVYGAQKWSSSMGSNAVDIFVRRGTPVYAPTSGTLQQGANGQLILMGDNGISFAFRHGQTTAQGHVQRGQQIGVVNDPGMDQLGQAPWGNMPDGYQHLELSVSRGNNFPGTPGGGGSIDAAQWLDSIGYRGQKIGRTPGPPDARGGGGMGMGGPMSMFGGGGGPGGMGGSPFGMGGSPFGGGGNPFMSMMGGGSGGGFNPMGMQGGFNPMSMFGLGGFGGR